MLPKTIRLPLREEQDIFKKASRINGKYFVVYVRSNQKSPSSPRFAVVVPKKTAILATQRNYCKRVVESSVCELYQQMSIKHTSFLVGKEIVLYLKKSFKKEELSEVKQELQTFFSKINK